MRRLAPAAALLPASGTGEPWQPTRSASGVPPQHARPRHRTDRGAGRIVRRRPLPRGAHFAVRSARAAREIRRVLRPGGRVAIAVSRPREQTPGSRSCSTHSAPSCARPCRHLVYRARSRSPPPPSSPGCWSRVRIRARRGPATQQAKAVREAARNRAAAAQR